MADLSKSGGRCNLKVGNTPYSLRAAATIRPARMVTEANANYDNSMFRNTRPALATAEITLSDHLGVDVVKIMEERLDITFEHFDMGRTDLFTQAWVVGEPQINMETGEITGFTVSTDRHRVVEA